MLDKAARRKKYRPKNHPDLKRAAELRLKQAEYDFKRHFGLPFSVKRDMFADQNGRCANLGCQKVLPSVYKAHCDHDHDTSKIRGLLCHGCNVALGSVGDNPHKLEGLKQYLLQALEGRRDSQMGVVTGPTPFRR